MWPFVDGIPVLEISIRNPLIDEVDSGETFVATLDTGYSGFLFIPERQFRDLGFSKLKTKSATATLADGSTLHMKSSFGSIVFPSLQGLTLDGLVETSKGASEILIGMEGIRLLSLKLDCCRKTVTAEECV